MWSNTGVTENILPGSGPTRQVEAKIPVNTTRFMHLKITRP